MTRFNAAVVGLVLLAGGTCCWNSAIAGEAAPDTDSMLAAGKVDAYLVAAKTYLAAHAGDSGSAGFALEALMVACTHRKTSAVTDLKAILVLDHGETLEGRFALTQFADAETCRGFLDEVIAQRIDDLKPPMARKYTAAVRRAAGFWGANVMSDEGFLLRTALAANVAGDKVTHRQCLSRLEGNKPEVAEAAKLAFDSKIDAIRRIVALQALAEAVPAATDLVRYFHGRLSEVGRARPEILRVVGGNLLADGRFVDARGVLRRLVTAIPDDGQAVVWSAWADAVAGDAVDAGSAVSGLRSFARKHEDSKWATTATKLAGAIAGQRVRLATTVSEIDGILGDWRTEQPQLVKLRLVYSLENGSKLDGFVSFDSKAKRFEATAVRNGGLVVGISSAPQGSRVFFAEDPVIYHLDGQAVFPQPQFSLTRGPDGKFKGLLQLTASNKLTVMQDLTGMISSSPWLSTRKGMAEVLNHLVRGKGWYPAETVRRDGQLRLRLVRPRIKQPGLDETMVQLDRRRRRITVRRDPFDVTIAYGDPETTAWLSGPKWPDLPKRATADGSMIFRVLGVAGSLLDNGATRTVTRPKPGVRR